MDIDSWSVTAIDVESGLCSPGFVSAQVVAILDNLLAINSIVKPHFVLGYLESRLKELERKSQILASLAPPDALRRPSYSMTSTYEGNPLAAMSASASRSNTFYPSDSGFESGGGSFSSSMTSIATIMSCSTVLDAWPYPVNVPTTMLGFEANDVNLLGQLYQKKRRIQQTPRHSFSISFKPQLYGHYCPSPAPVSPSIGRPKSRRSTISSINTNIAETTL